MIDRAAPVAIWDNAILGNSRPTRRMVLKMALLASGARAVMARPGVIRTDDGPVNAVAISPRGDLLAMAQSGRIRVQTRSMEAPWFATGGRLESIHDLVFLDPGRLIAAGGSPGRVGSLEVWDLEKRASVALWKITKDTLYRVVPIRQDQRWVVASHDGTCCVVDGTDGKILVEYRGHSRPVLALGLVGDPVEAISGGVDGTIQVWSCSTGKTVRTMDNHQGSITDLALAPGRTGASALLASVGEDRTVRLWQPSLGRMMRFHKLGFTPRAVCWHPDGSRLAVGGDRGMLSIHSAETLQSLKRWDPGVGRILAMASAADGKTLLVGGAERPTSIDW